MSNTGDPEFSNLMFEGKDLAVKPFELIEVVQLSYAWVSYPPLLGATEVSDEDILCGWCNKSRAEIMKTEDPNEHVEHHAKEDEDAEKI